VTQRNLIGAKSTADSDFAEMKDPTVLHIVPRLPGSLDGVGTYASNLANELLARYGALSRFVEGNDLARLRESAHDAVLLHYVNYGYHARGIPFHLPGALRQLRGHGPGVVVTIFHELYASGPPWRSAFWLYPFQRGIARSIARLSDACVVTNRTAQGQLRGLAAEIPVSVQPVPSNFGEPILTRAQIEAKDPHRWAICGGTALLEKSVRSFHRILSRVPEQFYPRELFVLGGNDSPAVREMLKDFSGVKWSYQPQVDALAASETLSRCSLAWLDYFHGPTAPVDALFKSSVFAALCVHGVIAVLPHKMAPLVLEQETLPGLFFVDNFTTELPSRDGRAEIGWKLHEWYHRRASLKELARVIGHALGFEGASVFTS
jgi:hypothetical protein